MRTALLALALVSFPAPRAAQALEDPRLRVETYAAGYAAPVCATFVAPGELLVIQNADGRVLRTLNGVPQNVVLDLTVSFQGARGIVADPDVATNGFVYIYYGSSSIADNGPWEETRVMRYTFDGTNLVAPFGPLFTVPFDATQSNGNAYNAGTLRIGPDGMLYGMVGDKGRGRFADPRVEQNTGSGGSSLAGAIFRITTSGVVPADNPFVGEADPGFHPWFLYGFRNSLGMDFDPRTGSLWFSDNSVGDYDELNRGDAGMNSGWVKIFGPDARDATYSLNGETAYDAADLSYLAGAFYRDPEFSFKDAIGITVVEFLSSRRFPEDLWDDVVVGDSNLGQLYHFELAPGRTELALTGGLSDRVADDAAERDVTRWATGLGTVTDSAIGPDGYLYLVSWEHHVVYRVRPLVDRVEPETVVVTAGDLLAGDAAALLADDDVRLSVRAEPRERRFEHTAVELRCVLNDAVPTRLDLVVEARANRAGGQQAVELFHVPSDSWRVVDRCGLSRADASVTVSDVPAPSDFVHPSTREVRVRIRQRAAVQPLGSVPGLVPGSSPPPTLVTEIDQVRVLATLP